MSDDYKIPKGALGMEEPYHSIGMKWMGYAKTQYDGNDITVAIWSAMREAMSLQEDRIRELEKRASLLLESMEYTLVPNEPTDEMLHELCIGWDSCCNRLMDSNYRSMIELVRNNK